MKYASPHCFYGLELSGDPNTVYSFHNHQPGPYHCRKRRELTDQSTYYYPGFIPRKPRGNPHDFDLVHSGATEGKFWNRSELLTEWREVFAFRRRHDVPLFSGEFGCVSDFHEQGIHWTVYSAMFRTSDPYWQTHFDCCLYIDYAPEGRLHRFQPKIELIRFFCRTVADVLRLRQPQDEWVGVYGVRRPHGGLALLLSNEDREADRSVTLSIRGLPGRWTATLQTMERGDDRFVSRPHLEFVAGRAELCLPPLSLALVSIPAFGDRLWTRSCIS